LLERTMETASHLSMRSQYLNIITPSTLIRSSINMMTWWRPLHDPSSSLFLRRLSAQITPSIMACMLRVPTQNRHAVKFRTLKLGSAAAHSHLLHLVPFVSIQCHYRQDHSPTATDKKSECRLCSALQAHRDDH
jgi:hypothetical protein